MEIDCFVDITRQDVCRGIGYTAEVEPSPRIASLIDEYLDNARHLIEPSYAYSILQVEGTEDNRAFLQHNTVFESTVISRLIRTCTSAALFVLTIGPRLEEMAAKLADDGMIVESYVLDTIGSSAAEKMADFVQGIIHEVAHLENLSISRRFSPGYCDWPITQQQALFRAIEGNNTGVEITDDSLMTPQKSISGIIGMGPDHCDVTGYNPCKTCTKRTCVGRR